MTLIRSPRIPAATNGCASIDGRKVKPVFVDQRPIERNPHSNSATFTEFVDIIRDYFAARARLSTSHFCSTVRKAFVRFVKAWVR